MESNTTVIYSIHNQVDFLPHVNKLISCKTRQELSLYVTATRCFSLLIREQGQMVSHNALYAAGWENHGKIVTPNTLYQTISKLRKQLQEAGLSEDIIQTHPRQGWILSEKAIIERRIIDPATERKLRQADSHSSLKDFCRKIFGFYPKKMLTSFARLR